MNPVIFKLDNHPDEMVTNFEEFFRNSAFTDCAIICKDRVFQAHRLVLSAGSGYLKKCFLALKPGQLPAILIPNIPDDIFELVIEFLYRGQVVIPKDRIDELKSVSETFEIKALDDFLRDHQEMRMQQQIVQQSFLPGSSMGNRQTFKKRKINNWPDFPMPGGPNMAGLSSSMNNTFIENYFKNYRQQMMQSQASNAANESNVANGSNDDDLGGAGSAAKKRKLEESDQSNHNDASDEDSDGENNENDPDSSDEVTPARRKLNDSNKSASSQATSNDSGVNNQFVYNMDPSELNYGNEEGNNQNAQNDAEDDEEDGGEEPEIPQPSFEDFSRFLMQLAQRSNLAASTAVANNPFKCNHCKRSFEDYETLQSHIRRHHMVNRLHHCEICGKSYAWKSGLYKHNRAVHQIPQKTQESASSATTSGGGGPAENNLQDRDREEHDEDEDAGKPESNVEAN